MSCGSIWTYRNAIRAKRRWNSPKRRDIAERCGRPPPGGTDGASSFICGWAMTRPCSQQALQTTARELVDDAPDVLRAVTMTDQNRVRRIHDDHVLHAD